MPIYEYQCASCHHQFDLMQKISDPPATQCPQCAQGSLIKLVSAAGFQLKGTGWYATDFKNKGKPPENNTGTEKKESTITASSQDTTSTATKEVPATKPTTTLGDSK